MKKTITTNGYSLVEVLVAVSILMLSIVGPITIAAKSLQSAQYARQQNTAFFLAQEGISIINTLRNNAGLEASFDVSADAWAWTDDVNLAPCFTATGCNIDFRDTTPINNVADCADSASACTLLYDKTAPRAVYQLQQGEATPYTRVITLENIGADELIVKSTVQWSSTLLGDVQTITLDTSLFNLYE